MSRILKSSYINVVGQPLEVLPHDNEIVQKRKLIRNDVNNLDTNDPNVVAASIVEKANLDANEILENANEKVQEMLAGAQSEGEIIKANAKRDGYQEGYQQGLEDGRRETEELAHQALKIKEELEEERANLLNQIESELPNIIIQTVKKVIGMELTTNKEVILGLVAMALGKVSSNNPTVRVSEQDFDILEENKHELISEFKMISDFEIKKDLSLEAGDCIIETDCGDIDASIGNQLDKLEDVISSTVGNDENGK